MRTSPSAVASWRAYALALIGVLCFAATLPLTELALADFSAGFITLFRALIAGLLALAVVIVCRAPRPKSTERRGLLLSGLCLAYGFPVSMALGLETVPAYHGGVVLGVLPLVTACLAAWIHGERARPLFWFWALVGTGLVSLFAWQEGGGGWVMGDLWLVAAAFFAAYGYVISGDLSKTRGGWWVISWALIYWLPVSAVLTVVSWPDFFFSRPYVSVASLLALSVFSMYLGFFAWNQALAWGGVARIGQVQLLQVFLTLAWAALLLETSVDPSAWAFASAVMLTVYLGRKTQ